MMETGIYVRVSTEEQAQEGYSIRGQEQKLRDYARIKEWAIYKIYIDEGISGKNVVDRPGVNTLIEDIKAGKVKNVLVYKIDRLTRSIKDLIDFIDLFDKYNCAFNSLMENIDTHSATGRMFIKIIGIFAEFERENLIERVTLGFERKAREGYSMCTKSPSYGYDRKKGEKVQTINEAEAKVVKEIFGMFVYQHMSFADVARNLNARDIQTKQGVSWSARAVYLTLTNCNYIGNIRHAIKDENRYFETKGLHEPILSEEVYNEAQELISKLSKKVFKKHPKPDHYFAGVLVCGKCGEKLVMHGDYSKDQDGNTLPASYRCRNRANKTCDTRDIKQENIEKAFSEYIANIEDFHRLDEVELAAKEEIKKQNLELITDLKRQLKKLEAKEKEILHLYIDGKIDFDNYKSMVDTINEDKSQTASTLAGVESLVDEGVTIKREHIIKSLKENWELLDNAQRRQFVIDFIDKIEVIYEREPGKYKGDVKILNVEFSKV